MNRSDIMTKLTEIFQDVFDDESIVIKESTNATDIEDWDSLSHITLISEIEDGFDYKFQMKEVLGLKNVGDVLDILERNSGI